MIVRIVQGRVAANKEGLFHELVRQQTLPALRSQPGFVYGKFARRIEADGEHFLLMSEWRDAASLYGWAGPDLNKPRLIGPDLTLLDDYTVEHYEALDLDPEELERQGHTSDVLPEGEPPGADPAGGGGP